MSFCVWCYSFFCADVLKWYKQIFDRLQNTQQSQKKARKRKINETLQRKKGTREEEGTEERDFFCDEREGLPQLFINNNI